MSDPGWPSPHPWSTEKGKPPAPNSICSTEATVTLQGLAVPAARWPPTRLAAPGALSRDPPLLGAELDFLLATQMLGQGQRADLPDFIPGPVLEGRSLFSTPSSRILRLFFFSITSQMKFKRFKSERLISFLVILAFILCCLFSCTCTHMHTRTQTHTDYLPITGRWARVRRALTEGRTDEETWVQTLQKPLQNIWVCQNPKPLLPGSFPASV